MDRKPHRRISRSGRTPLPPRPRSLCPRSSPLPAIRLGTFNLSNLYSRWAFEPHSPGAPDHSASVKLRKTNVPSLVRLAEPSSAPTPTSSPSRRSSTQALDDFNARHLNGLYHERVLVEGSDARKMDVALLSRIPLGQIRGHQCWLHPARPGSPSSDATSSRSRSSPPIPGAASSGCSSLTSSPSTPTGGSPIPPSAGGPPGNQPLRRLEAESMPR